MLLHFLRLRSLLQPSFPEHTTSATDSKINTSKCLVQTAGHRRNRHFREVPAQNDFEFASGLRAMETHQPESVWYKTPPIYEYKKRQSERAQSGTCPKD